MTKLGSFNKKKGERKHNIKDMYGTGWYATAPAGERSNWKELATAPIARKRTLPLQEPDDSFSAVFELVCLPASEDNQRVSLAKRVCGITDIPCENNEIHQ